MNHHLHPSRALPLDHASAVLVGRAWVDGQGPVLVRVRGDGVTDLSRLAPTCSALLELDDVARRVREHDGARLGETAAFLANSAAGAVGPSGPRLLAPCDLQAIKAAGVTFVASMLERVIEEQARGDAARAESVRKAIVAVIGDNLARIRPGSPEAARLKEVLIAQGAWSQYLEVGIGPDAEVFTKAQPMSAVGFGAFVGIPSFSHWNNPEPEVVLVADARGRVVGASLGNDVNLRDVEGRSALLLGKAKDNNASAAIGPFVRLFDDRYTIDDVRKTVVTLTVRGEDGFELRGESSLERISRDPLELVRATIGENHQYPDGLCLFLGTMFAPVQDRGEKGKGFTHRFGDRVAITAERLGRLENVVQPTAACAPWTFGAFALAQNLAGRGLLDGPSRQ